MDLSALIAIMTLFMASMVMLWLAKDEIIFKLKLWIAKKRRKPILEVNLYRSDKTKIHLAIQPDTLERTIEADGNKYMYSPNSLNYNPQLQVQCAVLKEGCVNAIDTQTWEPGEVDPQRIAVALKVAKQRGREEADQSFENYKKYLYIIMAVTIATAALTLMMLQNTDQIATNTQTIMNLITTLTTTPTTITPIILNGTVIP